MDIFPGAFQMGLGPVTTFASGYFGDMDFSKKFGVCSGSLYIGFAIGLTLVNLIYDLSGTYSTALLVFVALGVVTTALFFVVLPTKS